MGAGTMGQGIAQVASLAGFNVLLYDVDNNMLEKAVVLIRKNLDKGIEKGKVTPAEKEQALEKIALSNNIRNLDAEIVIEAIIEKLEVKQKLFGELEKLNASTTIFATNTSSIPITQIGAKLTHPERLVGMHFFNPVHIMKLVEVISGAATDEMVTQQVRELVLKFGKTPVMAKDSPGFIVNRVARHFYVESLKILEENVADVETIDKLIESSGFRMGPFRLMDLIGVDTNFFVTSAMFNAFHQDSKFRPSHIQQQKVDAGHHGRKSGKGFYNYED